MLVILTSALAVVQAHAGALFASKLPALPFVALAGLETSTALGVAVGSSMTPAGVASSAASYFAAAMTVARLQLAALAAGLPPVSLKAIEHFAAEATAFAQVLHCGFVPGLGSPAPGLVLDLVPHCAVFALLNFLSASFLSLLPHPQIQLLSADI